MWAYAVQKANETQIYTLWYTRREVTVKTIQEIPTPKLQLPSGLLNGPGGPNPGGQGC